MRASRWPTWDEARAGELASAINADNGSALAVQVEVTSEESVDSATQSAVDHFGRVDFLVHCAGNNMRSPILDLPAKEWSRVLDTHLTGAFLFSKAVGKRLVEQGEGGPCRVHVVGSSPVSGA